MRYCTAHRQPGTPALVVYNGSFLGRRTAEATATDLANEGIAGAIVIAPADLDGAAAEAARLLPKGEGAAVDNGAYGK